MRVMMPRATLRSSSICVTTKDTWSFSRLSGCHSRSGQWHWHRWRAGQRRCLYGCLPQFRRIFPESYIFSCFPCWCCLPHFWHLRGQWPAPVSLPAHPGCVPGCDRLPGSVLWHHPSSRRTGLWQEWRFPHRKFLPGLPFRNSNDSCLHDTVFINFRHSGSIFIQIEDLAFLQHRFFPAGDNAACLRI